MMGYNDGGEFNNMAAEPFNGRKLRPLIPRPSPCTTTTTTSSSGNDNRIKATDFFALNHHLAAEQNKREVISSPPVVVSSRWNPTPEQLRALEDLYRRGTRTPSADQIQHITAQLRRYGKIEGKNVFYWFQNHKARERQKRRREMELVPDQEFNLLNENFERKDQGSSRTANEVEQNKNWIPSTTNCSTLAEESVSISRAAKAVMAECRSDRWVQFNEGELQDRRNFIERNATWQQMMQLSSHPPTHHLMIPNNMTTTTVTSIPATTTTTTITTSPAPTTASMSMDAAKVLNKTHMDEQVEGCHGESLTLQLFPLRNSDDGDGNGTVVNEKETGILSAAEAMDASTFNPSYQFYEFLPMKK